MAAEAPAQPRPAVADRAAAGRAPLVERLTSAFLVVPGVAWLALTNPPGVTRLRPMRPLIGADRLV